MVCSVCHQDGHNKRTCPDTKTTVELKPKRKPVEEPSPQPLPKPLPQPPVKGTLSTSSETDSLSSDRPVDTKTYKGMIALCTSIMNKTKNDAGLTYELLKTLIIKHKSDIIVTGSPHINNSHDGLHISYKFPVHTKWYYTLHLYVHVDGPYYFGKKLTMLYKNQIHTLAEWD